MNYYVYRPDANNFAGIGVAPGQDARMVDIFFMDAPLAKGWKPVRFHDFDDNPKQEGDFPSLSNYNQLPVMSQRAWEALRPLIGFSCEALPILHPTGMLFYIVHVMDTIDCLDVHRSEVSTNSVTNRISRIFRYALKLDMLQDKHIFKLPLERGGELLVDDEFRRAVETNGLTGLRFKELPMIDAPTANH